VMTSTGTTVAISSDIPNARINILAAQNDSKQIHHDIPECDELQLTNQNQEPFFFLQGRRMTPTILLLQLKNSKCVPLSWSTRLLRILSTVFRSIQPNQTYHGGLCLVLMFEMEPF
jgi:hypothetical protein